MYFTKAAKIIKKSAMNGYRPYPNLVVVVAFISSLIITNTKITN